MVSFLSSYDLAWLVRGSNGGNRGVPCLYSYEILIESGQYSSNTLSGLLLPTMHLIIYISDHTGPAADIAQHLDDICRTAKARNPELMITGLLFYHEGNFLQAIEGEKTNLEALMANLESDPRHKNITRIVDTEIGARSFSDWNMDTFNLQIGESVSRETIAEYEKIFSSQWVMDTWMFVETLKAMHRDNYLKKIVVGSP